MPARPGRICAKCPRLATAGSCYCAAHQDAGKRQEREYKARSKDLRRLYSTKRWRITRIHVLAEDPRCSHINEDGTRCPWLATDVDHKIRAELWVANGRDFFDPANLQGLCHAHHSAKTADEVGFGGNTAFARVRKWVCNAAAYALRRVLGQRSAMAGHYTRVCNTCQAPIQQANQSERA